MIVRPKDFAKKEPSLKKTVVTAKKNKVYIYKKASVPCVSDEWLTQLLMIYHNTGIIESHKKIRYESYLSNFFGVKGLFKFCLMQCATFESYAGLNHKSVSKS